MYTVMIIDDEPAAISYMSQILEKKCPDFKVIDVASDGKEGLEKVIKKLPDVVIADICMPIIDGLEFVEILRKRGLDTMVLIVSGHSEFDYARRAIQSNVLDYILKPVMPAEIERIFIMLKTKLDYQRYIKKNQILRQICLGTEFKSEEVSKYIGNQKFYMALVRYNGLPLDFENSNSNRVFSELTEEIFTYGRDERENLYIFPEEVVRHNSFMKILNKRIMRDTVEKGYCTSIIYWNAIIFEDMEAMIQKMYKILRQNIILGESRVIEVSKYSDENIVAEKKEQHIWNTLQYYSEKGKTTEYKKELRKIIFLWQERRYPLFWIETQIKRLMIKRKKEQEYFATKDEYQEDQNTITDIFLNSTSVEQLWSGIEEIFFGRDEESISAQKLDTEQLVKKICRYINDNMKNISSVEEISRKYNVSQTYLSKIFRKQTGISVSAYLTSVRMEKAKELVIYSPEILIKDVAEQIGYKDQFYFSRVFRTHTGKSPTDYIVEYRE